MTEVNHAAMRFHALIWSCLGGGLVAGMIFSFLLYLLMEKPAFTFGYFATCLALGLATGGLFFLLTRLFLKKALRQQLSLLQGLTANQSGPGALDSVEDLSLEMQRTVNAIQQILIALKTNLEKFAPNHQALIDASRFLLARAEDGMQAAQSARADVDGMFEKQKAVMEEVAVLTERAQDEAALSRELSASLEEIAGALDHSTRQFLETTRSVDELVESIQDSASQADQVARTMEGTAHDLDEIGEAFNELRNGAENSAGKADAVRQNAEDGLKVVESFMTEMARIDQGGQQATTAMQRLSRRTDEATRILEVIKGLISDTELLAFNAAIIAAKAGSEGRGFSVVAEEIRELADRTTTSAEEIEEIVQHIREDTLQVSETIVSTSRFITRGTVLSQSTGDALSKIVESSQQAAQDSHQLADHSGEQRARARKLIEDAGSSLRSVRAIAQNIQQQESSIGRIQTGVSEMKSAADQIGRGFDEQVKANHEFDRSMLAREEQVKAINEATRFQMETVERIFDHFGRSSERLTSNAEKARAILEETKGLGDSAARLRELSGHFQGGD